MAVRYADCTRRQHRNREASETRFAQTADASLSDFGTSDVAPSTGIHCNGNGNRNCNCNCDGDCNCNCNCNRNRNRNRNCNGRCAERQGQLQRTQGTLAWHEALDRQHVDRAGGWQRTVCEPLRNHAGYADACAAGWRHSRFISGLTLVPWSRMDMVMTTSVICISSRARPVGRPCWIA